MLLKLLKWIGYLLLTTFFVVSLAFSVKERRHVECRNIQIEIDEDDIIKISKKEIMRLVINADKNIIGKELNKINTEFIETQVEKHKAICKAEVFKVIAKDTMAYKGIIGVRVRHREPIARIISSAGIYYLDEMGEKVPYSNDYTANVVVTTGHFSEKFAENKLLPFIIYLKEDPFWCAQVEQVHVERDGNVLITPLVGEHIIELGTLDDYQIKLRNLKAFYQQVLVEDKWDRYKKISVKFKKQIIAKKR